jgi:hypothetical protein
MTRQIFCIYFKLQTDRWRGFPWSQCSNFNTSGYKETQRNQGNMKIPLTPSADHSDRRFFGKIAAVGCVHRSHRAACNGEPGNDFEAI